MARCGACAAFATVQSLNEKTDLTLKTSFEIKKTKNKENIETKTRIRFAAYNVLFGLWAKPKSVGEMFKQYDLDVICFNEVPNGNWTARVGRVLGLDHAHVVRNDSFMHWFAGLSIELISDTSGLDLLLFLIGRRRTF